MLLGLRATVNTAYTPSQLVRALRRVKAIALPAKVTRVDVMDGGDGSCVVRLVDERRDAQLNAAISVTLTVEETRAWRAECRRVSAEVPGR